MAEGDEKTDKTTVDRVLKYISLGSILFLIGGIFYNTTYFAAFDIDIFDYMDLSECVSLFIPHSLYIFAISLVIAPLSLMLYLQQRWIVQQIEKKPSVLYERIFSSLPFVLLLFCMIFFRSSMTFDVPFEEAIGMLILFWVLTLAIQETLFYRKRFTYISNLVLSLGVYMMAFIGFAILDCRNKINAVKESKSAICVTLLINDTTKVKTDSTTAYIGQTKNYIFIYNRPTKATRAIPKTKVTEIEFTELPASDHKH